MLDYSSDYILRKRNEIIKDLQNRFEDIEILESVLIEKSEVRSPLYFLGKSLEILSEADYAYFAEGWEKCRGCRFEHEACLKYGIGIIEEIEY